MPRTNPLSQVLTIAEASHQFKLSIRYLHYLVVHKRLRGRRSNGTWLLDKSSLQQFLKTERKPGPKPRAIRKKTPREFS